MSTNVDTIVGPNQSPWTSVAFLNNNSPVLHVKSSCIFFWMVRLMVRYIHIYSIEKHTRSFDRSFYTCFAHSFVYSIEKHTRSFDRSIVHSFVSQQLLVCCYIRSIGSAAAAAAAAEADDCVCFKIVKALATGGATQHPQ